MGKKLQSRKKARLVMRLYEGVRFGGVFLHVLPFFFSEGNESARLASVFTELKT